MRACTGVFARFKFRKLDESGATATEFAMVLPMFLLLLLGIVNFGIVFNNYVQLANAAAVGARELSISRGSTTPYSGTINAIKAAAPNLTGSKITPTLTVGAVTCTADDAACMAAFGTGSTAVAAKVALTYPCDIKAFTFKLSTCSLSSASTGAVQ